MTADFRRMARRSLLGSAPAAVVAVAVLCTAGPADAQLRGRGDRGYVGPAYFQIPGVKGGWKAPNKSWIRTESHYWKASAAPNLARQDGQRQGGQGAAPGQAGNQPAQRGQADQDGQAAGRAQATQRAQAGQGQGQGGGLFGRRANYSIPAAPRQGPGSIVISVDKQSPAISALMERCEKQTVMPDITYTVEADRSRAPLEMGPRPAGVPDFVDFKLKNSQIVDCPVVEKAPEQAFIVKFDDIEWVNWQPQVQQLAVKLQPAALPILPKLTGATKSWVVDWIAVAHDVSDDQCPVIHERPSEADYYALMSPDEVASEKALLGPMGPSFQNGTMGLRGPKKLNVTMLPGIVPDPGMPEPQTRVARGLNLDGDDGTKRKHKNYVSGDGKITGIDNQLYTAQGCIAGWMGHKGFILQFANNQMHDGQMSIMLEISGIDDEKNDEEVFVTLSYSLDPMAKSGSGDQILRDYTFNVTNNPEFTPYFSRLRAKIVDGEVITERLDQFRLNLGQYGMPPELKLEKAGMRLKLLPDGSLKGVLGGYRDWRVISSTYIASTAEFYHGFQQPALYNALKRNADGMKNPITGEYDGISTAYDIEAIPAFLVPATRNIARADGAAAPNEKLARNAE